MTGPVSFARIPPRRSTTRAATWWGRAWVRAVEEAAYSDGDLHAARALSRSGLIGAITVDRGSLVAACSDRSDVWSVSGTVPELDPISRRAFVEVVAAESGHLASLLRGELPYRLIEQAEEAGVELLPYGGELGSACPCGAWADPCIHALAVLLQVAWPVDGDPWEPISPPRWTPRCAPPGCSHWPRILRRRSVTCSERPAGRRPGRSRRREPSGAAPRASPRRRSVPRRIDTLRVDQEIQPQIGLLDVHRLTAPNHARGVAFCQSDVRAGSRWTIYQRG